MDFNLPDYYFGHVFKNDFLFSKIRKTGKTRLVPSFFVLNNTKNTKFR